MGKGDGRQFVTSSSSALLIKITTELITVTLKYYKNVL